MDIRQAAHALNGQVNGRYVRFPGIGHSARDRSAWLLEDWQAPDGFLVGSFAGDDPLAIKDYVRAKLGLEPWRPRAPAEISAGRMSDPQFRVSVKSEFRLQPHGGQICSPSISTARHGDKSPPSVPTHDPNLNSGFALDLFKNAGPIVGTPGGTYLVQRGALEQTDALRFHGICPRGRERHPAILALLRCAQTNRPRAIQRIYLRRDGSDRLRDEAGGKLTLGPAAGCVVKLSPDDSVTVGLGICEGIEKSLALLRIGWGPMWATCGTSNMSTFPVLNGIETLTIFADSDAAGQRAAETCATRWAVAGRAVKIITPKISGTDWSDALAQVAA